MIETQRESLATLKFGVVTALEATTHRVRVRLPDLDDLETAWLPVLTLRTHRDRVTHLPDVGEHVAVLLDPNGEDGVVLGAIFSARDPAPGSGPDITAARFADGTVVEYDRASHRLLLSVRGPVQIVADGPVTVTAPSVTLDSPQVTVTGHLTVGNGLSISGGSGAAATISGNVSVQGNIDASGSIMDAGGNSNHHSH
ncbi:phage baseplate assembly protein V [Pelomicrobium methylotrophicum]|uniref:Phage baseplate assembly protein V n=1 Tax=Pelomicrobium methylotrophicum TaxID=2602750 RepID=A0A5C7EV29_9PROT|nr:phage baseplate assembly protein V [Pelomicrobium methylotrophicum]TXF11937.1 phage baseplate assembly protein V [Pelomicrobium methylotrophicum]